MVAVGNWFLVTRRAFCIRCLINVVAVRRAEPERLLGTPRFKYAEIRAMCGPFANWRDRAPQSRASCFHINSKPDPARPRQVPCWYWVMLLPLMLLLFHHIITCRCDFVP